MGMHGLYLEARTDWVGPASDGLLAGIYQDCGVYCEVVDFYYIIFWVE